MKMQGRETGSCTMNPPLFYFMATDDPATCEWLPVRTLYNKELHLADFLRDAGIEHFLPFKYELADAKTDGVECSRRLVPAIHNLVFIHHVYDRQWCIDLMRRCPVEFHFLKREREGLDYATISHREMEIFMRACDPRLTGTRFIDPEQLREKKFTRVRVVKPGPLQGMEGDFVRFGGRHYIAVRVSGSAALLKVSWTWCEGVE